MAGSDVGTVVRNEFGSEPCAAEVVAVAMEGTYADWSDGSDAWEDAAAFLFIEPSSA